MAIPWIGPAGDDLVHQVIREAIGVHVQGVRQWTEDIIHSIDLARLPLKQAWSVEL